MRPVFQVTIAFMAGVVFVLAIAMLTTTGEAVVAGVDYETCRADCEASGRALWAWTPSSCECTP